MTRRAAGHDAPSIEELGLPFPVSLDLRAVAPAHAVAMADDLAGLALPPGSLVRGVTVTLAEFHTGHRIELVIATPAGPAVAALSREQLTDAHPVKWTLTYRRRAGSSDIERCVAAGPAELLERLLALAESIAVAQTPEPVKPKRRRKVPA